MPQCELPLIASIAGWMDQLTLEEPGEALAICVGGMVAREEEVEDKGPASLRGVRVVPEEPPGVGGRPQLAGEGAAVVGGQTAVVVGAQQVVQAGWAG